MGRILFVACSLLCSLKSSRSLPYPTFLSPPTAVRDDASVLLWSSQKVSLDRPAERQAAHINGPGVHMHRWTTAREHSQHFDDITPPLCSRPLSVCCWNRHTLSLAEKKRQASVREQGLAREEEGLLVSEWREPERERELFGGRRRVADGARGLGPHAHTGTYTGRQEDSEYRYVLWWLLFCLLDLKFSHSFFFLLCRRRSGFFSMKMGTRDFVASGQ